jgi:hypothetical protein
MWIGDKKMSTTGFRVWEKSWNSSERIPHLSQWPSQCKTQWLRSNLVRMSPLSKLVSLSRLFDPALSDLRSLWNSRNGSAVRDPTRKRARNRTEVLRFPDGTWWDLPYWAQWWEHRGLWAAWVWDRALRTTLRLPDIACRKTSWTATGRRHV